MINELFSMPTARVKEIFGPYRIPGDTSWIIPNNSIEGFTLIKGSDVFLVFDNDRLIAYSERVVDDVVSDRKDFLNKVFTELLNINEDELVCNYTDRDGWKEVTVCRLDLLGLDDIMQSV